MPPRPERIVFAGSPAFAVTQLDALLEAGWPLVGVLSQPDRPAGRRRRLTPTPVKARALEAGLPVQTPKGLRRDANRALLAAMAPDLLVVAAYGLILPQAVLDLPRFGCLNVHASLLPRWRGAAPVERAIMAGDRETGVCIMQMDAGLDTGGVRLRRSCPIEPGLTGGELEARLADLGAEALLDVLADLDGHPPVPQAETGACYARKLDRGDSVLDLSRPATELAHRVNALVPRAPAALATADGALRLRALGAETDAEPTDAAPGTVLALDRDGLTLATGGGRLRLRRAQLVGGKGTTLAGPDLYNALRDRLPTGGRLDGV